MSHNDSPTPALLDAAFSRRGVIAGASAVGAAALATTSDFMSTPAFAKATLPMALPGGAPFSVDGAYLDRHEILYQRPMSTPAEGFPLGNGVMGGLVWTHDDGIELQIHKNDIWSDSEQAGYGRAPRHAARVRLDLGAPIFSWIHCLDTFAGRLSLRRGEATFSAESNFGNNTVRTWLDQSSNLWVIEFDGDAAAGQPTATLERIGSRAFGGWYSGNFDRTTATAAGLSKAQITTTGRTLMLQESGGGMNFVVGLRMLGAAGEGRKLSQFRGQVTGKGGTCQILVAVATSEDAANPAAEVRRLLDAGEKAGVRSMRTKKDSWFADFWARSSVHIPDGYLENHWYLRRYLMASGSRGKYPVIFNGGLWRWNRDVTNWVTPHHWNMQQQYYGLCAQNDVDLIRPYWQTYNAMAQKPAMRELAVSRGASAEAIQLAEMHNFDGTMVDADRGDMRYDYTPAGQVANRFWEIYEYTLDEAFLRDTAYPFMQRAANFYVDKLTFVDASNTYTLDSFVYEDGNGFGLTTNSESDRAVIQALFTACIKAASILKISNARITKMQHILDHLWPHRFWNQERYPAGEVIAPSTKDMYSSHEWAVGGVLAYPGGIIGIDDRDSREGKAVQNFIKGTPNMYSHHPTGVIAARMGMADDALRLVRDGVSSMQYFPSGLMFNCTGYPDPIYQLDHFTNLIGRVNLWWKDFFQAGLETTSLTSLIVTEMLMQSNEGKIRVFASIPTEWDDEELAFDLMARGGFRVKARRVHKRAVSVMITSTLGGSCRIQNPWPGEDVTLHDGTTSVTLTAADVLTFDTTAKGEYLLRAASDQGTAPSVKYTSVPTPAAKQTEWGRRQLGIIPGAVATS